LIKVKIAVGSREARAALAEKICKQTGAEMVQSIGSVIVLLRRSATPDPRLSNLIKPL
jgi:RNA-binding protein